MMFLGVDLGGTNIKAAAVEGSGSIIAECSRPTRLPRSAEEVAGDIVLTLHDVMKNAGIVPSDVAGIGLGCPGTVDNERGCICYSNNLGWQNFDIRGCLKSKTGWDIQLANDANAAALGESVMGCAQGTHSAVVLTLGTGIGCGVVQEGRLLTGYTGAASELGHAVIVADGEICSCGRRGCLEAYASATALIRMTKRMMDEAPESLMHTISASDGNVSGRTAFRAKELGDAAGAAVVRQYIHYLADGITNIINIFFPEVIALSGGVANEGEKLLEPLREEVFRHVFGGVNPNKPMRIETCTLGYRAGVIGAAMLARDAQGWIIPQR